MSQKNPKLIFIQNIAEQERRLDHQISSEAKSAITNLQHRPKSYYTIEDVQDLVETLKEKMQSINKEAHTEFSKKGLRGIDNIGTIEPTDTLFPNEEITRLEEENRNLKEKISEVETLEMKIDELQILLDEKETEIAQLQSQSGIDSGKAHDQIEELNRLQEAYDEAQRAEKKAIQDREKIEAEFETVGNALMSTRLEIEELQEALGNKDIEIDNLTSEKNIQIENLKSEVQVLSNQAEENIELNETISTLQEEINSLKDKHRLELENQGKSATDMTQHIDDMESEINQMKERISQLEQENEDLLSDAGETSQEAIDIRNKYEETLQNLNQREEENKELLLRVERNEKESLNSSEQLETLRNEKGSLESRVNDLEVELKGKNERIQTIEANRNELRDNLASSKIEQEKQKTIEIDLKSQLGIKDRELEERQKDIERLREKQEEVVKQADYSRSKQAEVERERDKYESKLKSIQTQLEDTTNERDRFIKRFDEIEEDLADKNSEIESLKESNNYLEENIGKLKETFENFKINMSKNPKYALLFVLQDIQQGTVEELAKTVGLLKGGATRLLKELESEGWIDFNEEKNLAKLKKQIF